MDATGIPSAALGLAIVALIGRGVLAWLPPGEPGSHRPSELPAAWAASHVLGTVLVAALASGCALARVPFACAWVVAAGCALAAARWLLAPLALVPRHEVARERAGRSATLLLAAALAIAAAAAARAPADPHAGAWALHVQGLLSQGALPGFDGPGSSAGAAATPPLRSAALAVVSWPAGEVTPAAARFHLAATFLAALLLVERAMRTARRAPAGRRAVLVALALALWPAATPEDADLDVAACAALGLCGLVAWTRRADARGLALACAGAAATTLAAAGAWPFAVAALCSVVLASAPAARGRAALAASLAACALMLPWPLAAWLRGAPWLGEDPLAAVSSSWSLAADAGLVAWLAPAWVLAGAALGGTLVHELARASARAPAGRSPAALAPAAPGTAAVRAGFVAGGATDSAERAVGPDVPRRDLAALVCLCALLALLVGATVAAAALGGAAPALFARSWAPGLLVQAAPLAAVLAARALVRGERCAPRAP